MTFNDPRLPSRFWDRVTPEPNSGCWLWTGSVTQFGYGKFWWGSSNRNAHRVAYEQLVGAVQSTLHVDHICRTPCCVNPEHLQSLTPDENAARTKATRAQKGSCRAGHAWTEQTMSIEPHPNGHLRRRCLICKGVARRARRERRAA